MGSNKDSVHAFEEHGREGALAAMLQTFRGTKGEDEDDKEKRRTALRPWVEFRMYVEESVRFYFLHPSAVKQEVLSGFMVSILQVPESVAFSYVAGVHPMQGLYGSFWMGLITALLGGRPGMISGCAGALAVVIKEVMEDDGPFGHKCPEERREYLLFVMVLTGILQLICAALQCAHLVKLIPKTAFLGFFNGLAVVIFMSQLETFQKTPDTANVSGGIGCRAVDFGFRKDAEWYQLSERTTWLMITEVAIVMFFMIGIPLLPKIPMGRLGEVSLAKLVPPSLVGLLIAMAFEWWCLRANGWQTPVVKDVSRINGDLPPWHIPDVPWDQWETWSKSLPIAASLAAIGLVESVLTLQAVDQILDQQTPVWKKNQECFAQGLANLTSGFFKAMGGDAMIGQSTINVLNGAQGRLSALVAAAFMLLHIVVLDGFIEAVPTAALAGILFVVVIHTFNWPSLAIIFRRALPLYMCATIVIVTVLSVLTNLAIGIGVGILWESIVFVWREGSRLVVTPSDGENFKTYRVEGSLFFANTDTFNEHFTPQADPENVVVDFANSRILDFSALYTLNVLGRRYESAKKRLMLRMKDEDYRGYVNICDDENVAEDSRLRRYLPTKTVTSIHGQVTRSELLPCRYQEFEPLPTESGMGAKPGPPAAPAGNPPEVAGPGPEEPQGHSESLTSPKRRPSWGKAPVEDDSRASTAVKAPRGPGGEDAVEDFDSMASPPPSAEAAILNPRSPLMPSTPRSQQGVAPGAGPGETPEAAMPDVSMPGVPLDGDEPAAAGEKEGGEDNRSWVSEESV